MKIVFPKNIKKWLLSGMSLQIWPISISIIQLFIMAVWIALWLTIFNAISKSWSRAAWLFFAIIIILIFAIIAFFKVSELWLIPFIAKIIRNNFFDTTKKFQNNYSKVDKTQIKIQEVKEIEKKLKVEIKTWNKFDKDKLQNIEKWWLL